MKNWELLAAIDHEMMLIDINLMEWQGHLDMAALAGVGQPLELWTDDIPPRVITKETLTKAAGKPVRVMQMQDGEWGQVGTAEIDADGRLLATLTRDVPELTRGVIGSFSIRPPHDSINFVPSPEYLELAATPGSGVIEIPRVNLDRFLNIVDKNKRIPNPDNHPFFKE